MTLHSRKLKLGDWESILPDALHSVRSLLCTSTNTTPHERMFNFERKSTCGKSLPSWVKPGPVYVRKHVKSSKNDPPVSPATLLHANPEYAHVRLPSGHETTVSIRDISEFTAPPNDLPVPLQTPNDLPVQLQTQNNVIAPHAPTQSINNGDQVQQEQAPAANELSERGINRQQSPTHQDSNTTDIIPESPVRRERSGRIRRLPKKFEQFDMN